MRKLTELELEKIQQLHQNENELNQLKFQLGDLTTQISVLSDLVKQKHIVLMNENSALKEALEAKYGKDFRISEDGTIMETEIPLVETEEVN